MKREWDSPVLTVLAKSTSEEKVLLGCKADSGEGSGPGAYSECVEIVTNPGGVHIDYCSQATMS